MEDWNDIVFLDSEIVEDDDDAPVGTLFERENAVPEVAEQQDNTAEMANEEPVLSQSQEEQAQPKDEQEPETALETVDSDENAVEEQAEPTEETPAPTEDEEQAQAVEKVDEQAQAEKPSTEVVEDAVEEPTPSVEQADEQVVEEKAEEPEKAVEDEKEVKKVEPKAEKAKSTPQNKQEKATPNIAISIKDSSSINDALFDTSFEIERPQKAKVVSTKKKQEKEQDLWSVAPIAQKKTAKLTATEEKAEDKKPVKRAPSKATTEKVAADTQDKPTAKKKATNQPAQTTATTKVDNKKTKAEENKKMAKETETAAKEIDWIQEPTEKYAGTYVIKKTDKGNFVFKLFAYNKNCLAIGAQPYTSIAGCKGGINSIIKNAATAPVANLTLKNPENTDKFPRWEIYQDKKGEFRLRLIASNGNLVATTNDGYMQASGAKKGIESIAKASIGCGIRRDDNLW